MADIHHLITWGIGTPSDVPHFLLVGLSLGVGPPVQGLGLRRGDDPAPTLGPGVGRRAQTISPGSGGRDGA